MTDEISNILDTAVVAEANQKTRKEIMSEWSDKVNDAWKAAKDSVYQSVFDIGDLLNRAREELSDKEFAEMVAGSILESRSNALAYMRVARKDCLREEAIFRHLPLKVGVLIDLGCETWTRDHIVQAITEGVIHPQATRSKIQQWMEKQRIVDDHIEEEDTSFPEGVGIAGTQSTTFPEGPPKRQTPNLNIEKPYHQNPCHRGSDDNEPEDDDKAKRKSAQFTIKASSDWTKQQQDIVEDKLRYLLEPFGELTLKRSDPEWPEHKNGLSASTIKVLKNFAAINKSLWVDKGKRITTASPVQQNIFAVADLEDEFPYSFGVLDISKFLAILSSFDRYDIEFNERSMSITEGSKNLIYQYVDKKFILLPPLEDLEIELPASLIEFDVPQRIWTEAMKSIHVLGLDDFVIAGEGGVIKLKSHTPKDPNSSAFEYQVGQTNKEFNVIFRSTQISLLSDGNYHIAISDGSTLFKTKWVSYYIAPEHASTYPEAVDIQQQAA